ncbi:formamidopyrimidine-DNA glycosylase [Geotalea daltonii FRC-32]|uniref:Formamidopyrimidine-DNA glycosylase n=1 Tax=Geotalea daltonii (strain DSM 22248 / JCM 15807 / FRC-32) TaxID=316067 RepID=FPG_GEODF|nr:bifunctional DNA-formamidopyrimidine glycosylase/DNA-(apurinic or apyrimidinic site) lyase [Geotalea daltonii]B9M5V2.1 RecName: Full=Formamidopyrimidine-DNA glycosylase; Short=Fapy-DNA glycosylase; AltName: Full=DNA-(apurinic or apyrimidinic site) lyase MutM; Short=AP lyase MutM [Geotalea daltonii FRC-32]ACM19933.1 formamidopyrimidine-DNA glycosylase [Geotalea daltonii FRC-32]
MPELPEVETIRRAVGPQVRGKRIIHTNVRATKLRHPLPPELDRLLVGQLIVAMDRRGKYLLLRCKGGTIIFHLGMTGMLYLVKASSPHGKHDHLDLVLDGSYILRFTDPRRFGTIIWTDNDPLQHPLLVAHGPEPLEAEFSASYLYLKRHRRKIPIKQLIMDSRVVAGIGNIYANESLFRAGIAPQTSASDLSPDKDLLLVDAIKGVLTDAVEAGTSNIESALTGERPQGYFPYEFSIYGKKGRPCPKCGSAIRMMRLGGRSTFFCPLCQK